jgi:hypothetical protein
MTIPRSTRPFAALAVAFSLTTGSVASAAPANAGAVNPLVALSVFGTAQSRAAVCAAGAAAATAAAAQAQPGCVLPAADAPPPPVATNVPPPVVPYAPAYAAGAPNLLPLFAALGLFAGVFFLLDDTILGDDDDEVLQLPPRSPV